MSQSKVQDVLQELLDGNKRYVTGNLKHPHSDLQYRQGLIGGQKPIAAILGCSDSRVPLEMVFDQGLGDIFVIRVAGNVANEVTIGSVEFAVGVLNVPLVMVMGHESCGAIKAAVNGGSFQGYLHNLIEYIRPAVRRAGGVEGDLIENTTRINAKIMSQNLIDRSDLIADAVNQKKIQLVSAYYNLSTGHVEIL